MRVLVTGGTGLIGAATVDALQGRGHEVRLLSRHAHDDAERWPGHVETRDGDVANPASLRGVAEGCGAVIHIAGIVSADAADMERVNVSGTKHLLHEATASRVPRFILVSSLGAERGTSSYQRTKIEAENAVRAWNGGWVIMRAGNVYGPGDHVVSLLLQMLRTLPAMPVIGGSSLEFQPIWMDDLGAALAAAVDGDGIERATLELAGPDVTTIDDILDRLERMTGKTRPRVSVPAGIAELGTALADLVPIHLPIHRDQVVMLRERNVLTNPRDNGLLALGVTPTRLDDGLRRLVNEQPEQLPAEGRGPLLRHQYVASIAGSRLKADALFAVLTSEFQALVPITFRGDARLMEGTTLTMALPGRGDVQVRVEEVTPRSMTLVTLAGHPLAGAIRFAVDEREDTVELRVESHERPASVPDLIAMRSGGAILQRQTWESMLERVIERSGGRGSIRMEKQQVSERDARTVERRLRGMVNRRRARQAGRQAR